MLFLFNSQFPIKDPVVVFTIVLFVIFLVPLVLQRIKIPGIIGMILAGTALGPTGLHVLERSYAIELFGTVGLLYIMFQAGLEIDMNDFRKTRQKSFVFGFLSFIFPQVLGTLGAVYLLGLGWPSAILLASMFASHTLIAFPIISRLDLLKNEAVTITLGGTLVVNMLALLVLAVVAKSTQGELNTEFWVGLAASIAVFTFLVLWVGPIIVRWFFKNVENTGPIQFIFVLFFAFASSAGAKIAGIEAIIGAFLAGLAINRLVPPTSSLMNRIDFVGSALFIPFFLINVGMLADLTILLKGKEALIGVGIVVGLAISLKWLPAQITGWIFKYRREETKIIFGLSVAQAASTLAAALIGYKLGLVNDNVLNGIIIMILVTCMISSFVVEHSGKKLLAIEVQKIPEIPAERERILVPVSKLESINPLIDLAILIKTKKSEEPIFPLSIIPDDESSQQRVLVLQKALEKAIKYAAIADVELKPVTRVDLHAGGGIVRSVKELMPTRIIIGWHGRYNPKDYLFGTVLDYLLAHTPNLILVTYLKHPLNTMKKIIAVIPENATLESGFFDGLTVLKTLVSRTVGKLHLLGPEITVQKTAFILKKSRPTIEIDLQTFEDWDNFSSLSHQATEYHLFIFIAAREGSVSHHPYMNKMPKNLSKHFQAINFIVLYPEQKID
jgi:Kef-type K+ transport system membrane component KefB